MQSVSLWVMILSPDSCIKGLGTSNILYTEICHVNHLKEKISLLKWAGCAVKIENSKA